MTADDTTSESSAPDGIACGCTHAADPPPAVSARALPLREARATVRARIAELRQELKAAKVRRKVAIRDAKERCRAERIQARERVRAERLRALAELREWGRQERAGARQACAARLADARAIKDEIERARAKEKAEKARQRELAKVAKEERRRKNPGAVVPRETDDEVRQKLASELAPLFERVKQKIKAGRGKTRTEVFLAYAEKHPAEALAAAGDVAERRVRELEEEKKEAHKTLSAYETKKAARVERMRAKAERLTAEAEGAYGAAKARSDLIPMGQPILVGHHSERRHRRDIDRIHRGFGKAFELQKEAEVLRRRADVAENSRAISSDDPEAVPKLRERLDALEKKRARMVEVNRAVRSKRPRETLAALGMPEHVIDKLLTKDELGNLGIPPYALRNAAAEGMRLRQRIELLEAKASAAPPAAVAVPGARIEQADNRVRIVFDQKPGEELRKRLKGAGFRWSPTAGAWQRHASNAAWYHAKEILGVNGGGAGA